MVIKKLKCCCGGNIIASCIDGIDFNNIDNDTILLKCDKMDWHDNSTCLGFGTIERNRVWYGNWKGKKTYLLKKIDNRGRNAKANR